MNKETGNGKDKMNYNNINIKTLRQASKNLEATWAKTSKGQAIYQGVNQRLTQVSNHMEYLSGLTVLDIGSNQGLHSCYASAFCPKVYGVEGNEGAYNRSVKTKKWFLENGYDVKHVSFHNSEFSKFSIPEDVNGVIAACVIYNMTDPNIEKFFEAVDQSKRVIYQTRPNSMKRIAGRSKYNVCLTKDVCKMFEDRGFSIDSTHYEDTKWPVILAEKE